MKMTEEQIMNRIKELDIKGLLNALQQEAMNEEKAKTFGETIYYSKTCVMIKEEILKRTKGIE